MKYMYLVVVLGLTLVGCNEYPGQAVKEIVKPVEIPKDNIKFTLKPDWGPSIGEDLPLGGDCHIDSINDKMAEGSEPHTVSQSGAAMKVYGWGAIAAKDGVTATDIALALKSKSGGARLFAKPLRYKRPDVAEYFKSPASVDTGFKAEISLNDVSPGQYVLEVIQHKEGKYFKCQYTANLVVTK